MACVCPATQPMSTAHQNTSSALVDKARWVADAYARVPAPAASAGAVPAMSSWYQRCPAVIPASLVYDPNTNPDGVRCTIQDNTVNAFGIDPESGFARRPIDNVGVQYGLKAFNDGVISFDQFTELNELAGGYDADGNLVDRRTVANAEALHIAYQTGRVNSGAGGLADVPIIDVRGYTDVNVDILDRFRSFPTRDRLLAANGHADNHVIWIADRTASIVGAPHNNEAVLLIDECWLRFAVTKVRELRQEGRAQQARRGCGHVLDTYGRADC
jgi:hypothetical protein